MTTLELIPGNWLYNAGVIGFLRVMDAVGEDVGKWLKDDGTIEVRFTIPDVETLVLRWFSGYYDQYSAESLKDKTRAEWEKKVSQCKKEGESEEFCKTRVFWGTLFNVLVRGLFDANSQRVKENLPRFLRFAKWALSPREKTSDPVLCNFCTKPLLKDEKQEGKIYLTSEHVRLLGASPTGKGMPNSFWNLRPDLTICSTCTWMLLTYPLALHRTGNDQIFLNAPSFKLMWYLNRVGREIFSRAGAWTVRELFGTTLMEMSLRYQLALGQWTAMNVEVVMIRRENQQTFVDFWSLPTERILLLTDPGIASLLKTLGDVTYLRWVMDGREERLLEKAQRLLRDVMAKARSFEEKHHRAMGLLKLYTRVKEIQESQGGVYA
ncbi:MAG: type I-B CRISPR-associated protein Cas8b1/Cst1 [Candidatus Hydrothermae bacterium]|nr:type I-B CRISPR-associated protein Cas8b1/Cst1 [Candidatus Hydrothermae bacterium]